MSYTAIALGKEIYTGNSFDETLSQLEDEVCNIRLQRREDTSSPKEDNVFLYFHPDNISYIEKNFKIRDENTKKTISIFKAKEEFCQQNNINFY